MCIVNLLLILLFLKYLYFIINRILHRIPNRDKMQSDDAKFIKKRLKGGNLEPHPFECSIIVNYKLEAAVYNNKDMADPMLADKKDCQRIIRLKTLNAKTDVSVLAKEVVSKCDLIHKSQLSDVEQIIYFLKNRKGSNSSLRSKSEARILDRSFMDNEKASIRNIEEYIELLYEELPERIKGASCILQLARNPDNLEELQKNEAVLSALSRVLREDWRKSIDLSTNIIYTFFCFSTYTHFHAVIVQYKIGSLCMDVIEHEIKRFDQMKMDLEKRKNPETASMADSRESCREELDGTLMNVEKPKEMEPPRRRIPELKQRPKSGNWSSMSTSSSSTSLFKAYSMNNSYHEGLFRELQIKSPDANTSDNSTEDETKRLKEETEKMNRQFKTFTKKQEQLLRVSLYMLLNLSENTKLEEKMRRKNIIYMLVRVLERQNVDLLILAVTFLKKLSIIKDNKDEMKDLNFVEKLPRLLHSSSQDLIKITLKLIFNLSFDGQFRSKFLRNGLLPTFVQFMSSDEHSIVVKILYHMSIDDKVKNYFAHTDCIHLLIDLLLLNLNKESDTDLIALGINLALNKKCAQKMCEQNRLKSLIERAFKYNDVLLIKMIRNISMHDDLMKEYLPFVDSFARALSENDMDDDFKIECVGILGNMNSISLSLLLDFSQVLQTHNLLPIIKEILTPGRMKDDLVLEVIIFLSTCTMNNEVCAMMCKSEIVLALIELLKAKQEDDELVLQIIFMFQQVLKNECTRNYIIKETETPAYLIDLMHDKNQEVRKVCDQCLDIISLADSQWATRIKLEKFRNHNSQWLSMVSDNDNDIGEEEEDIDMPVFLNSDYLTQIYQSGESNESRPQSEDDDEYNMMQNLKDTPNGVN